MDPGFSWTPEGLGEWPNEPISATPDFEDSPPSQDDDWSSKSSAPVTSADLGTDGPQAGLDGDAQDEPSPWKLATIAEIMVAGSARPRSSGCASITANPDRWRDDEAIAGEDGPPRDEQEMLDELQAGVRKAETLPQLINALYDEDLDD